MRTNGAPTRHFSALTVALLSTVCVTIFCANMALSQNLRRQSRIQRRIDRKTPRPAGAQNKLTPSNSAKEEPGAPGGDAGRPEAERLPVPQGGYNLEGIRERGLPSLFSQEELSLWIPGFGNRAALLMILRQLDLTPEQKIRIRDLRRQVGTRLRSSRQELNQLEAQLNEAIYGIEPASLDSYDPDKVKELTEQVIQKRAEWFRLQTEIESQFRQILTPDQFYVYRELALQMAPAASRPFFNPAIRRQQQQRRMGTQPNPQSRPN